MATKVKNITQETVNRRKVNVPVAVPQVDAQALLGALLGALQGSTPKPVDEKRPYDFSQAGMTKEVVEFLLIAVAHERGKYTRGNGRVAQGEDISWALTRSLNATYTSLGGKPSEIWGKKA